MTGIHPKDHELLHYLNNRCPELETRRIRRHLNDCSFCRERLSAFLDVELALNELPLISAPAGMSERVLQALKTDARSGDGSSSLSPSDRVFRSEAARKPKRSSELMNGMVAIAATYLFIATGIIGKITSFSADGLESGVRNGAIQLYQAVETVSRHLLS
ncbi:hypothetical protein P9314_06290 [Paenibacillus validus]|uniref:Zinc-finger domain-containing protein n=1 Tax=Paenibacillus validus TaxID=44253 RepID=A0A7X2ZBV7_9BACL|nr:MULTISPECIES: hypothetical protein [Paenibacillus]MED4600309.1 hypothetical protein [Paenibacillus validus]MED4606585.1 hypothetical protein [Paenibacillus validus]MUG72118.1 hypothetical protein [Paenibacillus validus]